MGLGHSSWGEQLESNEEEGINRLCRQGLVNGSFQDRNWSSVNGQEMRTRPGLVFGKFRDNPL